jgi:hypothetical protein
MIPPGGFEPCVKLIQSEPPQKLCFLAVRDHHIGLSGAAATAGIGTPSNSSPFRVVIKGLNSAARIFIDFFANPRNPKPSDA